MLLLLNRYTWFVFIESMYKENVDFLLISFMISFFCCEYKNVMLISFSFLIFNTTIAYLYYIGIAKFYLIFKTPLTYLNYIGVAKFSRDPFQESINWHRSKDGNTQCYIYFHGRNCLTASLAHTHSYLKRNYVHIESTP